jgi:hypothetical protein
MVGPHMTTKVVPCDVLAKAWYIRYGRDAYALGPYRFDEPVSADIVSEQAFEQFGEYPREIWPDGGTINTEPYEYTVSYEEGE